MCVYVIGRNGERLMPTIRMGKVRRMLADGRAVIAGRHPFTIRLTYETTAFTQPMEICADTGYAHMGLSVKSLKREYEAAQYDMLPDEKEKHDACRIYRRGRRGRKRHRKARFQNRKKPGGWLAPSLRHKADSHVDVIRSRMEAAPVTAVTVETGKFDIQALKAINEGRPLPVGEDYQRGPRYGFDTLRAAVLERDRHTCQFCGKGIKEGAILRAHHAYFWRGQHGDSMDELVTCCTECHTSANHKPGGKLWGFDRKLGKYNGAAFMNSVRWRIYSRVKEIAEQWGCAVRNTYGVETSRKRKELGALKSHVNDAWAIGDLHPYAMAPETHFQKRRRNNRCLRKFYDAKYIDRRDGKKKSGKELGCQRASRSESRKSDKNLRIFHGRKMEKGSVSIRKGRHPYRPGDRIFAKGRWHVVKGSKNLGKQVVTQGKCYLATSKIERVIHEGGWKRVRMQKAVGKRQALPPTGKPVGFRAINL